MQPVLSAVVLTLLFLSIGITPGLAGCAILRTPAAPPTLVPPVDEPLLDAGAVKELVATTLGPYPAHRPAQGNCYTIMTRPFVVPAPPSLPPGDAVRIDATATHLSSGKWLVEWSGGEWQVDERTGAAAALNDRAVALEATSKLPCPDQP